MRYDIGRLLGLSLFAGSLVLAGLAGCAPEEESTGIVRPKTKVSATPETPPPQTNQGGFTGGIKTDQNANSNETLPTNPPPPEPTPLPTFSPPAPPSLPPVIVPPTPDPTDPEATPTPDATPPSDMVDPSADPNGF